MRPFWKDASKIQKISRFFTLVTIGSFIALVISPIINELPKAGFAGIALWFILSLSIKFGLIKIAEIIKNEEYIPPERLGLSIKTYERFQEAFKHLPDILNQGSKIPEDLYKPMICLAAVAGDVRAIELILKVVDKDPDEIRMGGFTPLMLACLNGPSGAAERFLQAGANPSTKRDGGSIPLLELVRDTKGITNDEERNRILSLLIEYGAPAY